MARADENARTWSRWLQAAMAANNSSQADLERAGVATSGTISKWVGAQYAPDKLEVVIATAHALNAPDAVEALEAAGMHGTAHEIKKAIADAAGDPMLARIRNNRILTDAQKADMEAGYRKSQADTIHYYELQIADAERRQRDAQDGRARPRPPRENGDDGDDRAAL